MSRPRVYGPSPWPDCGTRTARRRHYHRGEKPCPECYGDGGPRERAACGTARGADAHYHRGEKPCLACRHARSQARGSGVFSGDPRPVRNGVPEVAYEWQARRYPWAERALARAEAEWGRPEEDAA